MSDIIRLLPDSVANQIAAGEVVQRPASVVKELLENSIDAGATSIDLYITDAGKTSIQVVDNGKGMSETDARMAFERHATSKITNANDLFQLHTMGFRGEALASIAAVAQVELRTRAKGDEMGVSITMEGPRCIDQHPIACGVGANFIVKNLFYNVPARRRFLKSNTTEMNNILQEFERVTMAHPDVAFRLFKDDVLALEMHNGTFKQRIVSLFGRSYDKNLLPMKVDTSIVKIDGFTGSPQSAKVKGFKQFLFVNGRYMRHPYFNRAVLSAYGHLIPQDKQVSFFIRLTVDPNQIDVNIHPSKTEIKFEDEGAIWQILFAATKDALGKYNAVPTIDFDTPAGMDIPSFDATKQVSEPKPTINADYNPFDSIEARPHYKPHNMRGWEELYTSARTTPNSVKNGFGHLSGEMGNGGLNNNSTGFGEGFLHPDNADVYSDSSSQQSGNISLPSGNDALQLDSAAVGGDMTALPSGNAVLRTDNSDFENEIGDGVTATYCEGSEDMSAGVQMGSLRFNKDELLFPNNADDGKDGDSVEAAYRRQMQGTFIQCAGRYIVTSVKSGLMVIDFVLAHRRILYDRFLQEMESGKSVSQALLFPDVLTLSLQQTIVFAAIKPQLIKAGFDLTSIGNNTYAINGVPAEAQDINAKALLLHLLDDYNREGLSYSELYHHLAITLAAAKGVGEGTSLSAQEMNNMVDNLFACQTPNFSPDGKPIIALISVDDLKKCFK